MSDCGGMQLDLDFKEGPGFPSYTTAFKAKKRVLGKEEVEECCMIAEEERALLSPKALHFAPHDHPSANSNF